MTTQLIIVFHSRFDSIELGTAFPLAHTTRGKQTDERRRKRSEEASANL